MVDLNDKDEQLIALLRQDGRISVSELARRMNLSRTAAQMRLQKLERNGVIEGYSVTLSPDYLKQRLQALVMIKFPPGMRASIEKLLGDITQVTSLYSISGAFDLAAVISAASMAELDATIDRIGCLAGIGETMSSIILSTKIDR
jgi:DNA-binding Lrp family transcriptional regulator